VTFRNNASLLTCIKLKVSEQANEYLFDVCRAMTEATPGSLMLIGVGPHIVHALLDWAIPSPFGMKMRVLEPPAPVGASLVRRTRTGGSGLGRSEPGRGRTSYLGKATPVCMVQLDLRKRPQTAMGTLEPCRIVVRPISDATSLPSSSFVWFLGVTNTSAAQPKELQQLPASSAAHLRHCGRRFLTAVRREGRRQGQGHMV
jgi:hypothetical protein